MTAAYTVRPIGPGRRGPATAVLITADEATGREALIRFAQMCMVGRFAELVEAVQVYDNQVAGYGHEYAEPWRVAVDEALDQISRDAESGFANLWRLRVGVEEVRDFEDAVERALDPRVTRIGVPA